MKHLYLVLLIFCSLLAQAQEVRLLQLNELEERINKGKDSFYIINYRATWCAPCIRELGHQGR